QRGTGPAHRLPAPAPDLAHPLAALQRDRPGIPSLPRPRKTRPSPHDVQPSGRRVARRRPSAAAAGVVPAPPLRPAIPAGGREITAATPTQPASLKTTCPSATGPAGVNASTANIHRPPMVPVVFAVR